MMETHQGQGFCLQIVHLKYYKYLSLPKNKQQFRNKNSALRSGLEIIFR